MAVYDDLHGWDTLPYIGSEFYLEYGRFDYYVTAPANMILAGSGELANPQEVLTTAQIDRLAQARASDKTVMIRTAQEATEPAKAPARGPRPGTSIWTKPATWPSAPRSAFLWDAARINLPGGKKSLAMSVYPAESAGDAAWGRSTEYLKDAVEHFSAQMVPVSVSGSDQRRRILLGMEYPGVLFDGINDKGKNLFWITAHEIGHGWFPMTVGSNERRNAFMDEGFNTFIDIFESDDFNNGEYGPKRDSNTRPAASPPTRS